MTARTIDVDGTRRPYVDLLKGLGRTGGPWLPASVGRVRAIGGLPVGVQVAGPFLEDRTTLAVGRFLQEALGGFRRPDGF